MTFFGLNGSLSNEAKSASKPLFFTAAQSLIMKRRSEKIGTKASQSTCLDRNLMHLCFCLVCQLLLGRVLANHQIPLKFIINKNKNTSQIHFLSLEGLHSSFFLSPPHNQAFLQIINQAKNTDEI